MAVFSLLSENLGNGIIIKNNKLFLDTSIDNVWTGKNFFSKPVIFSQNQIFPIENLSSDNTAPGSFIVFGEKQWKTIGPGSYGQSLIFTSKGPMWSNYNLSNTEGILPTSKGGTGWGKYPYNGILFSSDKEVLDLLPIPSGRKILFSENSLIHWEEFSDLADEILVRLPKPIESIKNKLIYKNSNPAFKLQDQLSAGLHFNNKSLNISINHTDLDDYAPDLPTSSICLNNENKNFLFELKTNVNKTLFESCFSIDSFGNIVKGSISLDQTTGTLPVSRGGTGLISYDFGDLIYAKNNNELGLLSAKNSEGFILRIIDGRPQYVPYEKTGFDGNFEIPVKFARPINNQPSITLNSGEILSSPIPGALEFDGKKIFITLDSKQRKELSFIDSDIIGLAENVKGIIELKNGGTGKNLENLDSGKIIIKNNSGVLDGLEFGEPGSVLISNGNQEPSWKYILNDISSEEFSGIKITKNNTNLTLKLDTSEEFNPRWQGLHYFDSYIESNTQLILNSSNFGDCTPLKIKPTKAPRICNDGEIWYDGKDLHISTAGKDINITKVDSTALPTYDYVPSHYLTLGAGSEVSDGRKIRIKVPVPHLVAKGSLVHTKWKLRRLEITIDETPVEDNAILKLYSNNKIILNSGVVLQNSSHAIFENFDESFVETGEMLQVECIKTGGSNFWSIFLLIDLI